MVLTRIAFEPAVSFEDALHRAATEWGIEREFYDIFGTKHVASAEIERRVLAAIGVDISSKEALEQERIRRFHQEAQMLSATQVVSEDCSARVSLAKGFQGQIRWLIQLEDGSTREGTTHVSDLLGVHELIHHERLHTLVYKLPLPADVPNGYHRLRVSNGSDAAECRLILTPDRMYSPEQAVPSGRTAGIAVTLYGLRSKRNWGCGDFTDLRGLIDWLGQDIGGSFIALNPLHALHNRAPYNTSPYLPLSIFYKNLIYIDIEQVPEFQACPAAQELLQSESVQKNLQELRATEFVEYERVDKLKKQFLRLLHGQFVRDCSSQTERSTAFDRYVKKEGDLLWKFALYCALDEVLHEQDQNRWTWRDWPAEYQTPDSPACASFAQEHGELIEFYQYVQFVIDEQLAATQDYAKQQGLAIGLYHDLALATDRCGSDLWAYRNFYVDGCRVGSPPDAFAPNGQDWAFPPPNAMAHKQNGYELFSQSIRKIVEHGGALRIDHVMRLFHLFWIPDGMSAAEGVYMKDNAHDLLRVLALESQRSKNLVIGEDLGTVTDEIRETLAHYGVLSYRLFYFEKRKDDSFKGSQEYPHPALVASTTHDLPTIAGFWTHQDIEARRQAGLVDENGSRAQHSDRNREKQRMLDCLHAEGLMPGDYTRDASQIRGLDGPLHNAIIGLIAQTPSALMLLNQEDLTKEVHQQNLPGSTAEYPNWSRKMHLLIEDLQQPGLAQDYASMFRNQIVRTGRQQRSS